MRCCLCVEAQSNKEPHCVLCCLLQALTEYRAELRDDPIINTHLATLYDNLLEQNLIRVIEPFSRVQVPKETQCSAASAVVALL